ncbi:tyrosine-protein phosphatase 99A-like [Patiria miniata]|uniref:protein-tyrosine-phosphatase n=1 Tax=Patiria miniata TaxID=46514 RepID=A0A914ARL0_PATMI|nr:tyrosine-protein phosphatase 99A-like [Patiria miniata]
MASLCLCRLRDVVLPALFLCAVLLPNKGLALNLRDKPTNQSTTTDPADSLPENAVDGNLYTISYTNLCAGDRWWRVDLEAIYCLKKITIINRVDGYGKRLAGAVVRAGLDPSDFSENTQIGDAVRSSQATNGATIDFIADPIVSARYVSVQKTNGILSLAEVMVVEIQDTSTVEGKVDFTLVANPARIGQTGDDTAVIQAYKGPNYASAGIIFGRQLTTGGSNVELPTGSMVVDDPQTICAVTLSSTLPESAGIDRTGVFYAQAVQNENVTRIQTIILNKDDGTVHTRPTQRTQIANIGESVVLQMENVNSSANSNYRWKHNGDDTARNSQLSVNISNAAVDDGGIYSCFVSGQESQQQHGFMRLIVRGCAAGMWGQDSCQNTCRRCYNGGICDDKTGTCICAPGFSGEYCQQVHGRHIFGQNASHTCSDSTDPHNDACRGRLFCLPDPYGCSCAAGYMGLDCMQECSEGKYGADCRQTCHCSSGDSCEKDTGECTGNCIPLYFGSNCQCSTDNGVLGLKVMPIDRYQLQVSWQPDPCVSGYILEYALTNRGQCEEIESPQWVSLPGPLDGQTTSHVITGLISSSTYMVYIRPLYNGTQGLEASTSGTTLRQENPSVSPVVVTSYDSARVTLSWREVYCANYFVQYALQNKEGCLPINPPTFIQHCLCSGTTSTKIPGLFANSMYEIQIFAKVNESSGETVTTSVHTSTKAPSAPPQQVTVTSTSKRSLTFSWSQPACGSRGGIITGYTYKLSGPGSRLIFNVFTAEQVEINGLIPFTNYSFQVAANTSAGAGPYSDVVNQRTNEAEPTVPLDVAIQNVDYVSITLQWSEPDPPQGIIIHYTVRYWRSGQSGKLTLINNVVQLMYEITGLETNETHFLQVQAETSVGAGPWSEKVFATTLIEAKKFEVPSQFAVIVPVAVVVVILALGFVVAFVVYKSSVNSNVNDGAAVNDTPHRHKSKSPRKPCKKQAGPEPPAEEEGKEQLEFVPPPPVRREELAEYIRQKEAVGDNGFQADYKSLPDGQLYPWTVAAKPENRAKNRYVNVIAYDHSRVVLDPLEGDPHSDYINACYINGYKTKNKYVASQGANKASIKDIWRMVWQLGIDKIVMLTNPFENGKRKCLQYWADTGSTTISGIVVTTDKEDVFLDYTIRNFSIHQVGCEESNRLVKQFHYTTWPDMQPPEYPAPLLNFMRLVNGHHNPGRTLVHCSAGVGRTGTFIALDAMQQQMAREGQVDVLGFIYQMRQNRIKMVQTPEQYKFIFDALLAASVTGDTTYSVADFRQKLTALKKKDKGAKETGLQKQFATLMQLSERRGKVKNMSGQLPENNDKNRYPDFIPSDRSRPYLFTSVQEDETNYINATFLPGYRKKSMYIGTQMPMPNTVTDFWRLMYDHKATSIVMLNTFDANDKTMCRYWPEEGTINFGKLSVELIQTKRSDSVTRCTFTLRNTDNASEEARTITQFQYHDWPSDQEIPNFVPGMLSLMDLARKWNGDKGPIVVHCMDGLGSTSVYCTLMALLDQFNVEKAVDVFQAAHRLRMVNQNMMNSLDQYALCYDVIQAMLDSTSIYENVTPSAGLDSTA